MFRKNFNLLSNSLIIGNVVKILTQFIIIFSVNDILVRVWFFSVNVYLIVSMLHFLNNKKNIKKLLSINIIIDTISFFVLFFSINNIKFFQFMPLLFGTVYYIFNCLFIKNTLIKKYMIVYLLLSIPIISIFYEKNNYIEIIALITSTGILYFLFFNVEKIIKKYAIKISNKNKKIIKYHKNIINKNKEIVIYQQEIIFRLVNIVEYRDNETSEHNTRIGIYANLLAIDMKKDKEFCDTIFSAAPMHDIGKIGISDTILFKNGKLTPEEYSEMKKHTIIGNDMLKNGNVKNSIIDMARDISLYHHENYDGSGYPYGLSGENIPLSARIVKIVDVYDALRSKRVYKSNWVESDIEMYMIEKKGLEFDTKIMETFLKNKDKYNNFIENKLKEC